MFYSNIHVLGCSAVPIIPRKHSPIQHTPNCSATKLMYCWEERVKSRRMAMRRRMRMVDSFK